MNGSEFEEAQDTTAEKLDEQGVKFSKPTDVTELNKQPSDAAESPDKPGTDFDVHKPTAPALSGPSPSAMGQASLAGGPEPSSAVLAETATAEGGVVSEAQAVETDPENGSDDKDHALPAGAEDGEKASEGARAKATDAPKAEEHDTLVAAALALGLIGLLILANRKQPTAT